ncbi:MAG: hypothetical protein A2Y80_07375 [Deltaproteobacteria bacterium RBG_13_58_19]|nr:MAG: hypothetical protein A2Y80_07375 [Deltaproteobacteria bacterium RBG_13_58_19]
MGGGPGEYFKGKKGKRRKGEKGFYLNYSFTLFAFLVPLAPSPKYCRAQDAACSGRRQVKL